MQGKFWGLMLCKVARPRIFLVTRTGLIKMSPQLHTVQLLTLDRWHCTLAAHNPCPCRRLIARGVGAYEGPK